MTQPLMVLDLLQAITRELNQRDLPPARLSPLTEHAYNTCETTRTKDRHQ